MKILLKTQLLVLISMVNLAWAADNMHDKDMSGHDHAKMKHHAKNNASSTATQK